jgi:DNA-binding LacI/PurR family transcriptional regulator
LNQIIQPRRATIQDVAKAAGVSTATVSNALSGRRPVDAATRARVQAVALQLGYAPDPAAQRLRTGKPAAIALLSAMPAAVAAGQSRLGFLMEIAAAAAEVALEAGLALVLVPPAATGSPRLDHLDVAGAIVIEPLEGDACVAALLARGLAVVAIGRADAGVPYVDLRADVIAELMLDHLRDQGARHIALLLGQQARPSYAETLSVYTQRVAEPIVARADEAGGEAAGCEACLRLLAAHPEIDAICAPVDALAAGAVAGLQAADRRIPQDVRVITRYDGLRARLSVPPLTAVDLDLDAIARRAVALLMRALGGDAGTPLPELPMPQLVIRGSTQALQAAPGMF